MIAELGVWFLVAAGLLIVGDLVARTYDYARTAEQEETHDGA